MVDVQKLSVKELRALIDQAGLSSRDCIEKVDLIERAQSALAKLETSAKPSTPDPVVRSCGVCGSSEKLKACQRCRSAWYCSRAHQKLQWKEHKSVCKDLGIVKAADIAQKLGDTLDTPVRLEGSRLFMTSMYDKLAERVFRVTQWKPSVKGQKAQLKCWCGSAPIGNGMLVLLSVPESTLLSLRKGSTSMTSQSDMRSRRASGTHSEWIKVPDLALPASMCPLEVEVGMYSSNRLDGTASYDVSVSTRGVGKPIDLSTVVGVSATTAFFGVNPDLSLAELPIAPGVRRECTTMSRSVTTCNPGDRAHLFLDVDNLPMLPVAKWRDAVAGRSPGPDRLSMLEKEDEKVFPLCIVLMFGEQATTNMEEFEEEVVTSLVHPMHSAPGEPEVMKMVRDQCDLTRLIDVVAQPSAVVHLTK